MGIKMCVDDDREQKLEEERCALEREKKKLAEQQDVAQRRIIQAESLMSKCSREVKAFQTYKVRIYWDGNEKCVNDVHIFP